MSYGRALWWMLLIAGCARPVAGAEEAPPHWLVIAHLDGRGGLGDVAQRYARELLAAAAPTVSVLVQVVGEVSAAGTSGVTRQWSKGGLPATSPALVAKLPAAASGGTLLTNLVIFGQSRFPANSCALVVLAHGGGLPGMATASGGLTALQMGHALRAARGQGGRKLAVVGLDVCFSGTLEVASELSDAAAYLTAAPGLIYSPGLDWRGALAHSQADSSGATLARELVRRGMLRPGPKDAALVAVDLARMDRAEECLGRLAGRLETGTEDDWRAVGLLRGQARSWGDHDELCDVGELSASLAQGVPSADLRQAAARLRQALGEGVIAQWWSPGSLPVGQAAALGLYFPARLESVPASYAAEFALATSSGWAFFLRDYWTWQRGLFLGSGS
jgi:hypothetical protein